MNNFIQQLGLLNPTAGWTEILIFMGIVLSIIVGASIWTKSFWIKVDGKISNPREADFYKKMFYTYPLWGFAQQIIVFSFLFYIQSMFPDFIWAGIVAATLFGFLHFPNWFLMLSTSFMAMVFIQHMEVFHNIYAVAVAHGVLATAWGKLSPDKISNSFTTWKNYVENHLIK